MIVVLMGIPTRELKYSNQHDIGVTGMIYYLTIVIVENQHIKSAYNK